MADRSSSILEQYDFQVIRTGRGRGAIVCETNCGLKLLKEYNGSLAKLETEDKILNALKETGVLTDTYVKNKMGRVLTIDNDGTKYIVKNWFDARECDVRSTGEILAAVRVLAKLHSAVRRIPDLDCENIKECQRVQEVPLLMEMEKHHRELKRVRAFIRGKRKKSNFELLVMNNYNLFYNQGEEALSRLRTSNYSILYEEACRQTMICHGNYNQHNIMVSGRKMVIVNFDKFEVNLQILDLYLFMRKIMEKHNWDCSLGDSMLNEYQKEMSLSIEERQILFILFLYPEKFWKLVNHYYNNNKAWIPQKDIDKLEGIIRQNRERELFLKGLYLI